jgi:hypothetical protein
MSETLRVQLCDINCSQSSIRSRLGDGSSVKDLIKNLRDDAVKASSLDIRVFRTNSGKLWALDHRRTWAVREAKGVQFWLKVTVVDDRSEFESKFTNPSGKWPMDTI